MQTRPDAAALLDAVATFLMEEIAVKVKDDKALAFRVMIAANLANIVSTELRTEDQRFSAEARRLKALLPHAADEQKLWSAKGSERHEALTSLEKELAARLRSGKIRADEKVLDHLVQTAKETLAVTNPRFELGDEP